MLSMKEAAERVGVSKSAIQQRIKNGSLSATRNPRGYYQIDESELLRVYPSLMVSKVDEMDAAKHIDKTVETSSIHDAVLFEKDATIARLLSEIEERKSEIGEWKRRHDKMQEQKQEVQDRLNNLLTDQSKQPKKGLLGRIFG